MQYTYREYVRLYTIIVLKLFSNPRQVSLPCHIYDMTIRTTANVQNMYKKKAQNKLLKSHKELKKKMESYKFPRPNK